MAHAQIMMINPFRRKNRAAFQGEMSCPYCSKYVDPTTKPMGFETEKRKIRCTGNIGPFIREYKCQICGGEWRYDLARRRVHPYSSFKKGLQLPGLKYKGKVPLLDKLIGEGKKS